MRISRKAVIGNCREARKNDDDKQLMGGREYYTYALFFVVHQHLLHGNKLFVALLFACLENLTGIKVVYKFFILYVFFIAT